MKKLICGILTVLLVLTLFTSCVDQTEETGAVIQVDPTEGSSNKDEFSVLLYFADKEYTMLVGEERVVDVPVSQRLEYSVLHELIAGPVITGAYFNQILNPETDIISISESENVLSITLSSEFLDWSFITYPDVSGNLDMIKRLAVYSVVNTVIEASGCSRVQLLVDREGSGTGQRIYLNEIGMGESGVLEPLGRNSFITMTAVYVLESVAEALISREYAGAYAYIASADAEGNISPEESAFVNAMQESEILLEEFSVVEVVESVNSDRLLLMVDYVTDSPTAGRKVHENVPVQMIKENSIWKITYTQVQSLLV